MRRRRSWADAPEWVKKGGSSVALTKQMLDHAVRIVGDKRNPRNLTGWTRGTIGTGFVITVPSGAFRNVSYGYVVTAHHVIDGQPKIEVQFANPFSPGEMWDPIELRDWYQPLDGVDLAFCHVQREDGPEQTIQGVGIAQHVMPPDMVPALGSTVHYIGYLEPYDRIVVRTGAIAALEQQGLKKSQPEYDYECHLVDCRSYDGFSGSPCFARDSYPVLRELDSQAFIAGLPTEGRPPLGSTAHVSALCGMLTEHLDADDEFGAVSRYGIGVLLPSREIWRALMTDERKEERRGWDKDHEAIQNAEGPQPHAISASGEETEFDRFDRLVGQLANTPKLKPEDAGD